MVFKNVDEHTIRCIMKEEELIEMGYQLEDLVQGKDQDVLQRFIEDITQKANDAGFHLTENHRAIQSMILPGNHIILNFSDRLPEDQINEMIKKFLAISDVVNTVGKDKLIDLLNKTGTEKVTAFNQCLDILKNGSSENLDNKQTPSKDYLLRFPNFDSVIAFCKAAPFMAPAILYKKHTEYFLLFDVNADNIKVIDRLLLLAGEFSGIMQANQHFSRNLKEHAEIIIPQNAMETLKTL